MIYFLFIDINCKYILHRWFKSLSAGVGLDNIEKSAVGTYTIVSNRDIHLRNELAKNEN